MKNRLFLFFVLAAFVLSVALPASTVFAAGKTATLVEFKHEPSKGWTAIFKITGDWKAADLKGNTITVGGKTYDLYCNFRDDNHISCTMHHDMGQLIGKPATFNFAGVVSNDVVPPKRICNTWYADWLAAFGGGGEEWTSTWEYWYYYNFAAYGSIMYGENTPIPEPYFYFYEEYGTDYLNGILAAENGNGEFVFWYYYEYELFQYSNRYCSAAEYTYDEAMIEWEGISFDAGEGYCDDEGCDEETISADCDEDGCWVCYDDECEYEPNNGSPE
jgi:hypothetical protein